MRDRRMLVRSLRGLYQRATAPWKSHLDRRYLTHAESAVMLSKLHDNLSSLRTRTRDQQDMLAATDRRVAESELAVTGLSERVAALEKDLRTHLVTLDTGIERLKDQTAEIRTEAAKGSALVAHEEPHALRKKLFESHRLALEGAEAIESLLQAELLLWQAIDAVDASRSEPESVGG